MNEKKGPLIVAFDGVDTSGKTTLADAVQLEMNRQHIFNPQRITIDKFHNPSDIRNRRGNLSPEGFFYDSFNISAILENIILPIRKGGKYIINGIYDYKTEKDVSISKIPLNSDIVILFDGIFLNRDELFNHWDLSIFLDVTFETVLKRAIKRDIELFGNIENIKKRYLKKYIPGERIYLELCRPKERAQIVIDNNNFKDPILLKKQ